ncbi:chemotaxis protein CheW [Pseudogulbenkiania sp. MAI-1]|uniref:chemotaxis protein CheW n=1 Tax=Pseudogulbenkiania sp. MAI-1 TaxID=990370 RepID=UPI00045E97AB|nr:chemotaxis protein CheW [Pseudogulbenkiania sp. MAI-1]
MEIQLLPFMLQGERFALPLAQVRRVLPALKATPLPGAPPVVAGVVDLRGQLVTVIDLCARLGWPASPARLWAPWIWACTARRDLLLPVDTVLSVRSAVSEDWTPVASLAKVPGSVAGVLRSSDGLYLLHDLDTFLSAAEEQALERGLVEYGSSEAAV